MKTLKLITLFIIYNLTLSISYAQSPVDSVGSGCALEFDGVNNYVDLAPINLGISNFTYECWININNLTTTGIKGILGDWYIAAPPPPYFYLALNFPSNNSITATFHRGSSSNIYASWSVPIGFTGWHHVAGIYNRSGNMDLYVDGVLRASSYIGSAVGINIDNGNNLQFGIWGIGADVTNNGYRYLGQLDEVRIWNRALTQTEIQQNMCKKLTGTEAGLVGYWRFDDCGGLTAIDATANGNNGTLN